MHLTVAYLFNGPRKLDLPESVLADLSRNAIESPLIFSINGGATHAGVREFSADEGTLGVNEALAAQLGLEVGSFVTIEPARLPKGTSVTLKTTMVRSDWKELLESWIPRSLTALTKGDQLVVPHLGVKLTLEVVSIEPQDAVCVTDTDMDLHIESPSEISDSPSGGNRIALLDEMVELNSSPVTWRLDPGTKIEARGDGEVYIGPEHATFSHSYIASLYGDQKMTLIAPGPVSAVGKGTVVLALVDSSDVSTSRIPGVRLCPTCDSRILQQNFALHTVHCARNTVRCDCGAIFHQRRIPEDHWHCSQCSKTGIGFAEAHRHEHDPESCECGSFEGEFGNVAHHRAAECPLRLHLCRFCHLLVPQEETTAITRAEGLSGHETDCGVRTTDCPFCMRPVRLKSLEAHISGHDAARQSRRAPDLCSNQNCPKPANPVSHLGLCEHCFGPLYSQQQDLDGSKLKSRVERRYILQLTRGCGNIWCQNQFCKTGSGMVRTVKECMSLVQDIMAQKEYWFCVDEITTRKAMFVDAGPAEFARGWRGMAITRCGTEAEACQWLNRNASRVIENA